MAFLATEQALSAIALRDLPAVEALEGDLAWGAIAYDASKDEAVFAAAKRAASRAGVDLYLELFKCRNAFSEARRDELTPEDFDLVDLKKPLSEEYKEYLSEHGGFFPWNAWNDSALYEDALKAWHETPSWRLEPQTPAIVKAIKSRFYRWATLMLKIADLTKLDKEKIVLASIKAKPEQCKQDGSREEFVEFVQKNF